MSYINDPDERTAHDMDAGDLEKRSGKNKIDKTTGRSLQGFGIRNGKLSDIIPDSKWGKILCALFVVLVAAQVIVALRFEIISTEAAKVLKSATYCYDTGEFLISAPYMSLLGLISRIIGMHPLSFANTVMPVIIIPLGYGAYIYLLRTLYGRNYADKTDSGIMVYASAIILCLLNIYGYQSELLLSFTLLGGYFTSACLVTHIIAPAAAALMIKRLQLRKDTSAVVNRDASAAVNQDTSAAINYDTVCDAGCADSDYNSEDDEYLEEWDMKKHKIINARNLTIALVLLAFILFASVFVLNNKINSLYDATVNLQNEITELTEINEELTEMQDDLTTDSESNK